MVLTCILSRQQEWYTITQRFLQWDYPIEELFFVITQLPQFPYIRNFSNYMHNNPSKFVLKYKYLR